MRLFLTGALVLTLAGCGGETPPAAPEPVASTLQPVPPPLPEAWIGRWAGPEGTFLQVDHVDGDRYRLTLLDNLDGPEVAYDAVGTSETLSFSRRGEPIAMRRGTGAETGFKWLDGKRDCIILVPNREGYCRD